VENVVGQSFYIKGVGVYESVEALNRELVVLGIESTAHTYGVGIATSSGHIIVNVNSVYVPIKGGIHPREAAEHHSKVSAETLKKALEKSKLNVKDDIDGIAVALGPGMGPCLRVGCSVARALAYYLDKPLIPVNHAIAHIEIAKLTTNAKDPLIIYVSGGNTVIMAYSEGRYRVFGETLDIPLGNCIDVFARELGLGHPGVPAVEQVARKGKKFINLPYTVKGQDVSFSGLLTMALRLAREGKHRLEDLCYSIIETAYNMVVEVAERALAHTRKRELVLTGGVARSRILQEKLRKMCELHDARFAVVPDEYAGDNGAMIAYTGALALKYGITIPLEESYVKQRWRIEEVDIPWVKR